MLLLPEAAGADHPQGRASEQDCVNLLQLVICILQVKTLFFIKICIFQIIILTLWRKYKNKQLRRIKLLNKISYETHPLSIRCYNLCPRYMGV